MIAHSLKLCSRGRTSSAPSQERSILNLEIQMATKAVKILQLRPILAQQTRPYYDTLRSMYLFQGNHTIDGLDLAIRSLLQITQPNVKVVGLIEGESGPMIPLEVLIVGEGAFQMINAEEVYSPVLWDKSNEGILPPSQLPLPQNQFTDQHEEQNGVHQDHVEEQQQVQHQQQQQQQQQAAQYDPWQNYEYFHQYGKLDIHREMLKDAYRTETYREAIQKHAESIKGKVVLDIGTGTGVLAIFCAKAGAKRVYAVEASNMADWTELVVANNGLADIVKVVKGRIEEVQLPEQVDIIISEWMGTFLIFESMLESVLFARNRWLKQGGLMFPSHGSIVLAPVAMDSLYAEKVDFWNKVYDIDMSVLVPFARKCAFEKPIIDQTVKPESVIAQPIVIKAFDLTTVPVEQPYEKTIVGFSFKAQKTGRMHGFSAWFDVVFNGDSTDPNKSVLLSTSPDHTPTHWHQDLFLFDSPHEVKEGQIIRGSIRYQRNPELLRHLIIDISFNVDHGNTFSKKFYLWGYEGQT